MLKSWRTRRRGREMMEWSMASSSSSSSLKSNRTAEWADFRLSGPTHLSPVNWSDDYHQCCVAACLVQSIYILHHQKITGGGGSTASLWWESFSFQIVQELKDDDSGTTIGAIFSYNGPRNAMAPSLAIAFRGTATTQDWKVNYRASMSELHETTRFQRAMQAVERVAAEGDRIGRRVWLCGHSLGAALALLVGKRMAKMGVYLDTFLFNPPFVLRKGGRILKRTAFGLLAVLGPPLLSLPMAVNYVFRQRDASKALHSSEAQLSFSNLCSWTPRLFVNPGDFICCEYIDHFQKQKKPGKEGQPKPSSVEELEQPFLLPSARLIQNGCTPTTRNGIDETHGLSQWWKPELKLQRKDYTVLSDSS